MLLGGKMEFDADDIHEAVRNNSVEEVRTILNAAPELVDAQMCSLTPLHLAAVDNNNKAVAELLLAYGADVNARGNSGATPLDQALAWDQDDVAELLRQHGGKGVQDSLLRLGELFQAVFKGDAERTQALLTIYPEFVNASDNEGVTPLGRAATAGHKNIAERLLAKGAKVGVWDKAGLTPLHRAAMEGHESLVQMLVKAGSDVTDKDSLGATPLHWAAYGNHKGIAVFLLASGADVNAKEHKGRRPLRMALRKRHKEMAKLLREHGGRK